MQIQRLDALATQDLQLQGLISQVLNYKLLAGGVHF